MTTTTNPPATGVRERGAKAAPAAPALDLDLLSFVDVFISQGMLRIDAEYPSRSEPGVMRSIIVRGDGTVAYHRCPATHPCYHVADPAAIVAEFHRRQYRMATDEHLRADDHWYALNEDSLDAEGKLQWGALGDILGERMARAGEARRAS